jgi:hypothetical protein
MTVPDQDISNALFEGSDHRPYTAGSLQNLGALHGFEQDHIVDAALVEIETVTLYDINYLEDRHPGKIEPEKRIKNEHLINSAQHLGRETGFLEHVVNRSQELIAVGDLPSQFANPVCGRIGRCDKDRPVGWHFLTSRGLVTNPSFQAVRNRF